MKERFLKIVDKIHFWFERKLEKRKSPRRIVFVMKQIRGVSKTNLLIGNEAYEM